MRDELNDDLSDLITNISLYMLLTSVIVIPDSQLAIVEQLNPLLQVCSHFTLKIHPDILSQTPRNQYSATTHNYTDI